MIEKILDNKAKEWKRIANQYIIYEWLETRASSNKLTPDTVKLAREAEEEKKKQEEKERQSAVFHEGVLKRSEKLEMRIAEKKAED